MRALYRPTLNGGKASDWLRPIPCQREGDKLPKGAYQSGNGYSTGVHLSEHLACVPSSRLIIQHQTNMDLHQPVNHTTSNQHGLTSTS